MNEEFNEIYNKCPYREGKCANCECPCVKYQAYLAVQDPEKVRVELSNFGLNEETETWLILMTMQKKFAARFHKVEGLTKEEIEHWINEYLVCIEDEVREVREHLNFYTGNSKTGLEAMYELKKEIIDILHFVMDEFIVGGIDAHKLKQYYLKMYTPNILSVKDFLKFAYENQNNFNLQTRDEIEQKIFILINKLLDCSGKVRQQISWKHWKKPLTIIDYNLLYEAFAETFKVLVDLFIAVGMKPDEVREVYIKKNLENIFRQQYGYLTGGKKK